MVPRSKFTPFFLFLLAFLVTVSKSYGQKYALGIKAGPSMTLATFRDPDLKKEFGTQPILGYTVTGLIQFPMEKEYAFIAEAGFTQKGRSLTFNSDEWKNRTTFHFIDMGMALRKSFEVRIKKNIPTKLYVNFGPNIEYLLNGKGRISAGGPGTKYKVKFDETPDANFNVNYYQNVNRWLFGLDFGVGGNATINRRQKVYVELRFTWGQTYLGRKGSNSYINILGFEDSLLCNFKTLSLTGAYLFDFDRKQAKMGRSTKDKAIKKRH